MDEHAGKLLAAGVAGFNTSHGSEDNLLKIGRLVEGHPGQTLGMEGLLEGVTFEEAFDAVTRKTGYPPDEEENPNRGRIDPARTAAGLVEAGGRIRDVAEGGGRFVFATGHPGALLLYYLGLAGWVEGLGGRALTTKTEARYKRETPLDWAGPVAVVGNGASLKHTHDHEPMREILGRVGAVDLVVADHGFAGAAISAGIETVAIMDTNDPALAVVSERGANAVVVPIDDNRPLNSYAAALEVLKAKPGQ